MPEYKISENTEANRLINNIIGELKTFSDGLVGNIKKLTQIGTALSSETRLPRLLEMIVDLAREFTNAEGGTLYILSPDRKELRFEIVQNTSLRVRMGGAGSKITWPAVKLITPEGEENHHNVSAHVALTGKLVNIPDVYDLEGFDFQGAKAFDQKNKYRSKSMLVLPLKDHENEIIGVLQLLNARSIQDGSIIPFSPETQTLALSLASQAAITLTKNRLIRGLENLFESFIRTIARAIDEKSPYTGGHVKRVAKIAMMIARKINQKREGPYSRIKFSEQELKELRTAAWMHDLGKITTPEYVVDKANKLETIYDRIEEIRTRFEVFKREAEIKFLKRKISLREKGRLKELTLCESEYQEELKKIEEDLQFIVKTNKGGEFLSPEKLKKIEEIARRKWRRGEEDLSWLSEDEVYNLSVSRGTLTSEERKKIQDHVRVTEMMLKELPFPKKLKNVPRYASAHHETLSGTGYHKGLKEEEIPLQARILALADVFEALSASDRPYKKGKTASEVLKILGFMVKDQHLDKDLYDLFIQEKIFAHYVKTEYKPEQIDLPL